MLRSGGWPGRCAGGSGGGCSLSGSGAPPSESTWASAGRRWPGRGGCAHRRASGPCLVATRPAAVVSRVAARACARVLRRARPWSFALGSTFAARHPRSRRERGFEGGAWQRPAAQRGAGRGTPMCEFSTGRSNSEGKGYLRHRRLPRPGTCCATKKAMPHVGSQAPPCAAVGDRALRVLLRRCHAPQTTGSPLPIGVATAHGVAAACGSPRPQKRPNPVARSRGHAALHGGALASTRAAAQFLADTPRTHSAEAGQAAPTPRRCPPRKPRRRRRSSTAATSAVDRRRGPPGPCGSSFVVG